MNTRQKQTLGPIILRLEQYFTANDIASEQTDQRRAILLSSCGSDTYSLIKKLVAPKLPKEKTFDEISKTVRDYYEPKPSSIVERFRFNTRVRHTNESVATYVAALRGIAQNCEFSNIDEQLCDWLVVGINNKPVQRRLLAKPKLMFKSAFDIAQSMEVVVKNTLDLCCAVASGPVSMGQNFVNKLRQQRPTSISQNLPSHLIKRQVLTLWQTT